MPSASRQPSSDVWALSPSELGLRLGTSGASAFSALQRPWRWNGERPDLSDRHWAALAAFGRELPRILSEQASPDGTRKLLLGLPRRAPALPVAGAAAVEDAIEVVHMPRAVRSPRVTLCVSSQVGCALGCQFCATAALGLRRQLSAGEIVAQVLVALRALGPRHPGQLTLVFMGMGEPLHNLASVAQAVRILTEPQGLGLAPRRISVSTVGLVPQIAELARMSPRPLLAVSLNATTDTLRSQLMPVNRRYPLGVLRDALLRYPCRPRECITIEYVLLAGVNDGPEDAARLADYCEGFPHHINVIPFNAHPLSRFRAPDEPAIEAFVRAVLARRRCVLSVRRSRGSEIAAACGQLAAGESRISGPRLVPGGGRGFGARQF